MSACARFAMLRRRFAGLLAGLVLLAPPAAPARDRWDALADTVFDHVTAEHGPPNFGTTVVQDRAGFIWAGAFGGLARWDGYRLRAFAPDPTRPGALPDGIIQALLADPAGGLWVGTNAHGLQHFDPATEQFTRVADGPAGIGHPSVLALAQGADRSLWVGTDAGLSHLDARGKVDVRLRADALPEPHVRALARALDGTLWIGTSAGLVRRDAQSGALAPVERLAGVEIDALVLATDGRVWAGTRGQGAFVVDPGTMKATGVTGAGAGALPTESVYCAVEARPGEIWLGTFGKGIVVVDATSGRAHRLRHEPALATSLANDSVWALLRDRAGRVWAATARGLSHADPTAQVARTVFGGAERGPGHVPDGDVLSLFAAADGKLWLGLGSHGVAALAADGSVATTVPADPARPADALPADRVTAITALSGTMYFGTVRGVYRADPDGRNVRRVAIGGNDPAMRVNALAATGDTLWVGARDNGLWRRTGDHDERVAGLTDERITALFAHRGALWVGTRDGLNRLDPATGRVAQYRAGGVLPAGFVSTVLVDRQGRVWAGTQGGGIVTFDAAAPAARAHARHFGAAEGLPSMNVSYLLEDRDGNIWASTDNGYARIDAATGAVHALLHGDGPAIMAAWSGSGAATAEGDMVFGGLGGLTVFHPAALRDWTWQAPVVVTELDINGVQVPAAAWNDASSRRDGGQAPLVMAANARQLRLEFAALDFSAPARLRYAYKLDGYDDSWTDTDASRRSVSYTRLPPGDYTLLLRGSNRAGVWSAAALALPLRVLPAWYQSAWFRALLAMLVLAAVAAAMRLRTAALRARQRELEHEVAARTAELHEQQDALLDMNRRLEASADTLRQMEAIGRSITANLDAEAVFAALRHHIAVLLGTGRVQLYRTDSAGACHLAHGAGAHANGALVAQAAAERIVISEARPAEPDGVLLYAPLIAGERVLGVMVVGAPDAALYDEREHVIIATLCAYAAIALLNAEARAQLVQQEKVASLSSLVAGMAHEVNTPLGVIVSAISGVSEALATLRAAAAAGKVTRAALEGRIGEAMEFATLVMRNADRAATLINTFKAVMVPRDDRPAQEIDLASYLPQMSALVRQDLQRAGHRMLIDVESALTVRAVPDALTEVLQRVLDNVRDHAFAPGTQGTVLIRARREPGAQVVLTVHDDGGGIAPEHLARVFDPFFTTRSGAGGHAGLGLHVAFNHATERLGGTLHIDSDGAGTTVTLRF